MKKTQVHEDLKKICATSVLRRFAVQLNEYPAMARHNNH